MLTHLLIKDFTLVDKLDLELECGLTAITGETGAGKSIMLDALGLALGDRTDADKVRAGKKKAEIQASFDITKLSYVKKWLDDNALLDGDDCILRRIVTHEGRSRAFINGQTVTLGQLRTLGDMLIDIHSQHEHQSLLNTNTHRRLLDAFGGLSTLAKQVKDAYQKWHCVHYKLNELRSESADLNARFQLLRYQVEELDQLALESGELDRLETEQRTLANADTINRAASNVASLCNQDQGLEDQLNYAVHQLTSLKEKPDALSEAESMLSNALIQLQEARGELDRYIDRQEQDESRLVEVEERLNAIYDIARKHRIAPDELVEHHQRLAEELSGMQSGDEQLEHLEHQLEESRAGYDQLAIQLSEQRQFAAARLAKAVNGKLTQLAMTNAKFSLDLQQGSAPAAHGNEVVEMLISTNPGQPAKPLAKVASGGELSRVSLAIQVVTAQTSTTPTLVFDEVDVGIGGTTGDEVGRLLRELGANGQVLCVTHLAQVASRGHHHLHVSKTASSKTGAVSQVRPLTMEEKICEVARMMGGNADSKRSLAHAREMLATA
ncbi:DNA repair protein RecN [Teredinibacter turnerae T7901]|uniref:DNA repair protein RecN n=1 Tax=Teredinibacter turnerae (strain ATCC 39867 / T7901) TaxID=377629 RepID=C5BQ35_TERTT|nr:DNA repair protein RecN [Teredinibacter turnerae]ACR13701.1 DNA repair protein RecN [Teredinibacter turnerae T7901]